MIENHFFFFIGTKNDISLSDMIYGCRRMIYLLCKYNIISVHIIREADIIPNHMILISIRKRKHKLTKKKEKPADTIVLTAGVANGYEKDGFVLFPN